jgi:hypothetical protein
LPASGLAAAADTVPMDEASGEPELHCTVCGRPLGQSPEDQPEWPTGPMCGDCYQAREMDNEIWWESDEA